MKWYRVATLESTQQGRRLTVAQKTFPWSKFIVKVYTDDDPEFESALVKYGFKYR